MRSLLFLISFTFLFSCSKRPKQVIVPEMAKSQFNTLYPQATDLKWKSEDDDFEAEFKMNGTKMSVIIDAQGKIIEEETAVAADELPAPVAQYLSNNYADYVIRKSEKVTRGGLSYFEIKLKKDGDKTEVVIGPDGKLIDEDALEANEGPAASDAAWQDRFYVDKSKLVSEGENDFFILQPGYKLVLEGLEKENKVRLEITVLNETRVVDGVTTRVLEERESENGALVEVSRNFYAIDPLTKDVYYFGEEVDVYENGKISGHEGAWQSGKNDAHFGLMMPGKVEIGNKFYQELAPAKAMDRAEIVSLSAALKTPAQNFENCLKTEESTPLEPDVIEYKLYAKGIGLIKDENLLLVSHENISQ